MPRLALVATIILLCLAGCGGGGSSNGSSSGSSGSGSTRNFSVTNRATNGTGASSAVNFSVTSAQILFNTGNFAFNNLAGDNPGPPPTFDFGLPYFFGQTVFVAIEGQGAPGDTGLYGYVATSPGGSAGAGANVVAVSVNAGPTGNYVNGVFADVTVCVPNTPTCQLIHNVLVDTGSSGVRILKSVISPAILALLAPDNAASGNPLVECLQFVDGFLWGPMKMADVKLAGEATAAPGGIGIPIQIIDDSSPPAFAVPSACSATGPNESTLGTLLANGVLGIGNFRQDCGQGCATTTLNHFYFACSSQSNCIDTLTPLAQQAQNPVWMFSSDKNGSAIQLPSVSASGAPSVSGSLIFGIGTQSNNALGSATVLILAADGSFSTTFGGNTYPGSIVDSGSNGIFFLNSALTQMPLCSGGGFYCPQ